jgi:hypothetical protein
VLYRARESQYIIGYKQKGLRGAGARDEVGSCVTSEGKKRDSQEPRHIQYKYAKARERKRERGRKGRLESNQIANPAPAGAPNGFHIYCK